ncbi:MAG: hypothetical protein HKN63_06155 [Rhodobacteraceae bacterium]|nr:hypothetical protein [Paracoccaceae bacterium]
MARPGRPQYLVSRALAPVVLALALTVSWSETSHSEGSADASEMTSDTQTRVLPETNLVIDIPMSWRDTPPEVLAQSQSAGLFGDESEAKDQLAAFDNYASAGELTAIMLISRPGPLDREPLEEIRTIETGVKLSRWLTWVVGAGMEIVSPSRAMDMDGATGATLSFLSGQSGDHDVVTMSFIVSGDDNLIIVDIAPRGSHDVLVLDEIRKSIRIQ